MIISTLLLSIKLSLEQTLLMFYSQHQECFTVVHLSKYLNNGAMIPEMQLYCLAIALLGLLEPNFLLELVKR